MHKLGTCGIAFLSELGSERCRTMIKLLCQSAACVLVAATLGGCSFLGVVGSALQTEKTDIAPPAAGASADADSADAAAPGSAAPESAEIVEAPFLTYEWDTGFSGFLSPPIEVRRAAKADCMSEGYQVAVVEVMALRGAVATATFICRGDTE